MPAKAIEWLVVRAEASAMRQVDAFIAAFVREQGVPPPMKRRAS